MDERKVLYTKEGRRYKEYYPNNHIPHNQLYFMEDDKFIPYNADTMSWYASHSRPKSGIWIVKDNGSSWIGDFDMKHFRIRLEKYREVVLKSIETALEKSEGKYISRNDIATSILDSFAEHEQELIDNNG